MFKSSGRTVGNSFRCGAYPDLFIHPEFAVDGLVFDAQPNLFVLAPTPERTGAAGSQCRGGFGEPILERAHLAGGFICHGESGNASGEGGKSSRISAVSQSRSSITIAQINFD